MSDRISLTIPRERPFHAVAHLVLGGLAVRHNLTVDHLEDLQVALGELLEHGDDPGDVTVELCVDDRTISAEIGPLEAATLRAATQTDEAGLGLSRVLATVVDGVEPTRDGTWLRLVKQVQEN
jgi:hypothetical protein